MNEIENENKEQKLKNYDGCEGKKMKKTVPKIGLQNIDLLLQLMIVF